MVEIRQIRSASLPLKVLCVLALGVVAVACAARRERQGAKGPALSEAAPAPPSATIRIDYAHKDDFLRTLTVTKFAAARLIPVAPGEVREGAAVVRFDGGVPVWKISADEGLSRRLLTELPLTAAGRKFALKQVTYGKPQRNFLQLVPDSGPPEPLEEGKYYVFEAERASGSASFQAIRVGADGEIEAYDAQPRAGESFELCCNLSLGFAASDNP